MATYPNPAIGQRLTASFIASMLPDIARKAADTTRTSTTTLADDSDLSLDVEANATYLLHFGMFYTHASTGIGLKIGWNYPTGLTMFYSASGMSLASSPGYSNDQSAGFIESSAPSFGNPASSLTSAVFGTGTVNVSSTAGTLTMQTAQGSSSATALFVKAGSFVSLKRIS